MALIATLPSAGGTAWPGETTGVQAAQKVVTPRVDYPKWSTVKATAVWLAVVGLLRWFGMLIGVPEDTGGGTPR